MVATGGQPSTPVEVEERVGPYRLIRRLGQGGMGVVYLAESPDHDEVALKVLRPHVAHDPTARARLEREVTTLQRVSHPGVAGIVDHDLHADRPYLVTRFIPGRPLDEQVEERGPLTPQRWLPLAGCLAESLQVIHSVGVVHRDVKPGNVMMLNGKPVLIDFGIAQGADDGRLTATGLVVGTPGYLSPEMIEGEMVSESADWWGWAATVTFAATGRRPFGKGPFEVVLHRVRTGQADLKGLDPRLEPLLAAALSPDRRDRPTSTEILTGLNRYAEGRDALVPNPHTPTTEVAQSPRTMVLNPPTAVLTQVDPDEGRPPYDDPVAVAQLVPPFIPPMSAFSPLRDKLRVVAAQRKARTAVPGQGPNQVPSHPAVYSPSPTAAQAPALPLPYQGSPYAGGPPGGPTVGPATGAGLVAGYAPTYPASPYPQQPYSQQPYSQQSYSQQPYPSYQPGPSYQAPQHQAAQPYSPQHSPQYSPNQPHSGGSPYQSGSRPGELAKRPGQEVAGQPAQAKAQLPSSRTGLLLALMVALVGLTALVPGAGLFVTVLLIVVARLIDRSSTALMRRRQLSGRRPSDGMMAVAASPLHLLTAGLITLPCLIAPLIAGFVFGGFAAGGLATSYGLDWPPLSAVGFAVGTFAGLVVVWWGPGGTSVRRGARVGLRSAVRPEWLSALLATALLAVGVAAFASAANGGGADWARTPIQAPGLSDRPSFGDLRDLPFLRDLPIVNR